MGGGHVSRPDFGMPQPDAAYPLTEFYLLAQQALEKSGSFMLPALYAGLHAPARRIYREEAAGYLQLARCFFSAMIDGNDYLSTLDWLIPAGVLDIILKGVFPITMIGILLYVLKKLYGRSK